LDTAYYDDVYQRKPSYDAKALELVGEIDGQIVGLIDIECESDPGNICSRVSEHNQHLAGMIWHLAVHPDFRRMGIAKSLLLEAKWLAQELGISRFEAWTRDDEWVEQWYLSQGFEQMQAYYHIYMKSDEFEFGGLSSSLELIKPQFVFAHYTGTDQNLLRKFKRAHNCKRFDLFF
jgi:GNAT superfamily N-acetyltransferase